MPNKGAAALKKVVHSARTNFMNLNPNTEEENLKVKKVLVDSGSTMKRFHPISKGRAGKILKRTCRILVEVSTDEGDK